MPAAATVYNHTALPLDVNALQTLAAVILASDCRLLLLSYFLFNCQLIRLLSLLTHRTCIIYFNPNIKVQASRIFSSISFLLRTY